MAIGTAQKSKSTDDRRLPDKVIEKQLSRVRRHIRLTDLISGFMTLAAGLLIFLLLMVLVDHWLFDLGRAFRWLALLVLIAGPTWYFATRIAPAMIRGINPAYAAQTIERSEPGLKNSVLNYLLLRRERAALHEVVFQAVQQQAAADVSHVVVEQTVDRSSIIKAGYILVAVMAIAGAYKILSPKDPIQTIQRIVTPWADIVRPARVVIRDIQPGDAEILQGSKLTISADVRGVKDEDQVALIYSTEDGQLIDRELRMKLDPSGLRFVADIAPEADGVQQSLTYRVVAGDTSTHDFQVRVVAAPTIQVDTVEYDFPAYTHRPREVMQQQGDVKAVEGTRVTIRARTNQTIQSATIHLRPSEGEGGNQKPAATSQRFPMDFRGTDAWRTIVLEMSEDRRVGKHSGYHLEFVNTLDQVSQRPVLHRIEVVPDLTPEVEILTPQKQRVEVPLSGQQPIEVRAIDPDYGLSQVQLKATVGGKEFLNESLMGADAQQQPGQFVTTFDFQPKQWKLAVNDQVSYWAEAADNRTAAQSDSPAPNIGRSRTFHIVVVADPPQQRGEPNAGKGAENKQQPEKPPAKPPLENPATSGNAKGGNASGKQATDGALPKDQQSGRDNQQPQNQRGAQTPQQENQKGPEQNAQNKQQQGASEEGGAGDPSSGNEKGSQSAAGSETKTGDSKPMPGQGTGAGQRGGSTPQNNGGSGEPTSTGKNTAGPGQHREAQGSEKRTEPLHDGEVFERALNKLQEKQKGGEQSPSPSSSELGAGGQRKDDQTSTTDAQGEEGSSSQRANSAQDASTKSGNEKAGEPAEQSGKANSAEKNKTASKNSAHKASEQQQPQGADQSKQAAKQKSDSDASDGEPKSADKSEKSEGGKAKPEGDSQSGEAQQTDKSQGAGDLQKGAPGEGGKSARGGLERPEQKTKQNEPSEKDGNKDPAISDNGESGSGLNSEDKTGSGSIEKAGEQNIENRDRKKEPGADNQAPQKEGEHGASTSKKQSDSKGGQSGDQSGGGKKGSGQGAKQPGNDSAGSQSSSDDGAGKSQEAGKGESSNKAGDDKSARSPTGEAGTKKGAGSGETAAGSGQQSGDAPDSQPQPLQGEDPSQPPRNGSKNGSAAGRGSARPSGGGVPGANPGGTPPENTDVPAGEAANVEYANRATDLVLEYLRDQQDNPDRELMDELGWTADDLKAFLNRWQALKEKALEDSTAKRELDESLRSLGIQPTRDTRRRGTQRTDDARGLRESGTDSKPPAIYEDQFRAFKKGTARGK